jgi:hypothetical protein
MTALNTSLHRAARLGKLHHVKYLLACGAKLKAKNPDYKSALSIAFENRHQDVYTFLTTISIHENRNFRDEADAPIGPVRYASRYLKSLGFRRLCGCGSPYFEKILGFNLHYEIILAVQHARRLIDAHDDADLDPFLRRLAAVPSAQSNSSPNTEGQVLRLIISFVGNGFALETAFARLVNPTLFRAAVKLKLTQKRLQNRATEKCQKLDSFIFGDKKDADAEET